MFAGGAPIRRRRPMHIDKYKLFTWMEKDIELKLNKPPNRAVYCCDFFMFFFTPKVFYDKITPKRDEKIIACFISVFVFCAFV